MPTVEENDVYLVNDQIMLKKTDRPYSGKVIVRFANGKTASMSTFKNGYRLGDWYIKGLADEIVQEGRYIGCPTELEQFAKKRFNVKRCSVSLWKEGTKSFVTLYLAEIDQREVSNFDGELVLNHFLKEYNRDISEIYITNKDSIIFHKIYN
ncbi:hypothetical protein [Chitinophaga terrae (ex Kim and Jung 2007)]|nr:hypothetical protein [Chitinophaga terrae (ex Kim and Jung 2007)]GEP89297.1 hypothetical protein CTE07_09420 [Chitinophaga terrae (ex Kim and Jung 2007)]